ncbi:MAG TPA: AMP-binding protein [Solirubrobacterales bacterium]|nr:AMP-binding protein [Solirubrobacterales bacterium]
MIYKSKRPDVEIPDATLPEHVLGEARERGEHPALIDGVSGGVITYAEFADVVDALAAGLQRDGLGRGDVFALVGGNSAEWAIAYHAILRAGGVVTPINPLLTPDEVGKQLSDSKTRGVIAMGPLVEPLRHAAERAGAEWVRALERGAEGSVFELAADGAEPEDVGIKPEDLAVLPYSSGTTGVMKGVVLSHRNLVANIEQIQDGITLSEDDTLVGVLPFFHIYGQTVVLNQGLAKGATIVTMPRFDLDGLLDIIENHGVTLLHIAPPVVLAFATAPQVEGRDFSGLRIVISGAAPLDEDLSGRAEARIGVPIRQGYGMTELSPVSHKTRVDDAAVTPPGSVGPLVPNTEARLVDPASGEDAAEGGEGEIWIRGPQVMVGYLDQPEATAQTLTDDGWLRTGDIARIDAGGYAFIVDRLKELIKYKGYQVPPAELEAVLVSHPQVKDAGVIGVPHEGGDEYPKACVVCEGDLGADELMAFVAERVAPYKKVREVEIVEEIPKSASGKILRRVLREQYGAAADA